jgi:uncharacterized protein
MNPEDDWNVQYKRTMSILKGDDPELANKFKKLCNEIKECKSGVIAFSGGVDSALLVFLGHKIMHDMLAVTADSPTISRSELSDARDFVNKFKINNRVISINELEDQRFVKNDGQRCFFCKDSLFRNLEEIRIKEHYDCIIDGSNYDDLSDFRPGWEAAQKNNVKSPLVDAKIKKDDIRKISESLNLPTWDKPQMACLSSRFPTGTPITQENLKKIEKAEELVKGLGYYDVRVRFHGDLAKIEIGTSDEIDLEKLQNLVPEIKKLGFKYVTLDLQGFRSGSLNE